MAQHRPIGGQLNSLGSLGGPQTRGPGGAPQAGPRGVVRPGPAPSSGMQGLQGRPVGGLRPRSVGHSHPLARGAGGGAAGGHIPLNRIFGDAPLGATNRAGSYRCIGRDGNQCVTDQQGAVLIGGVEDYYESGGKGPMCENCWADSWVIHNMQNKPELPQCRFGVHWEPPEFNKLQTLINDTIQNFLSPTEPDGRPRIGPDGRPWQTRYPTREEMNQVLQTVKFSRECPRCKMLLKGAKVPVTFNPDESDFEIVGVNTQAA